VESIRSIAEFYFDKNIFRQKPIFAGKNYFCRHSKNYFCPQKLFLPILFFTMKNRFFHRLAKTCQPCYVL